MQAIQRRRDGAAVHDQDVCPPEPGDFHMQDGQAMWCRWMGMMGHGGIQGQQLRERAAVGQLVQLWPFVAAARHAIALSLLVVGVVAVTAAA